MNDKGKEANKVIKIAAYWYLANLISYVILGSLGLFLSNFATLIYLGVFLTKHK